MSFRWVLAMLAISAHAQQLQGPPMGMPYDVSASCLQSLNQNVTCPDALAELAQSGGTIDSDGVTYLCTTDCQTSLENARDSIAQACTSSDVIVINEVAYPGTKKQSFQLPLCPSLTFPATFFADNYLYAYSLACRQDSSTGQYCDLLLANWSSQAILTTNQSCSDCWLGDQALQLNNPLGYDDSLASNFASLTSSCNATQYSYTTPTAYALNSTTATVSGPGNSATPPTSCSGSFTVQPTDTCFSLSSYLNVSTYDLLINNGLDMYCMNFNASIGTELCSPPSCETYTWQPEDTCAEVALANPPITLPQFLAWNPNFNSLCQNSGNFVGFEVCLSPPGGFIDSGTKSNLSVTTAGTVIMPAPTNALDGSNRDCGDWYTVIQGDTCGLVSVSNYISLSDFYFLNPELNANCTNLELGEAYCVQPVGDIHTYSGYTVTSGAPSITVPPNTFSSVDTAISVPTPGPGFNYTPSYLPPAPDTLSGCYFYANYSSTEPMDCMDIADEYAITTDDLIQWNPSLSSNLSDCSLQPGYSYCVELTDMSGDTTPNDCTPINATQIVAGTSTNCDCFVLLAGYYNTSYPCSDIESDYSITQDQLTTWNTWVDGSNCDSSLYNGLDSSDTRPLCVGVNASEPVGSVSSGPSATLSPTTITSGSATTTVSMGPTASGEVSGCQQYYTVVSGDSCNRIETLFDISFTQFYTWNPSIGSNCEDLLLGFAYCVQGPAPSTTATTAQPAPTQSGIASNCNNFYTVQSGDSCSAIETQYNDTFAELYQWNPSIGDNCQDLWVGYSICVGVSS